MKRNVLEKPDSPRILIVSTTGLGDTIWATPAIRTLKKTYPNAHLAVLTSETGKSILANNPDISEMYVLKHKGLLQLFSLARILRKKNFDTALIFHISQRFALPLVHFSCPSKIIGTTGINKNLDFFLTHPIEKRYEHEIQRRLNICRAIGTCKEETSMKLYPSISNKNQASTFVSSLQTKGPLIGLHPGAKDLFKQWPPSFFSDLITLLEQKLGAKVIITGDLAERTLGEKVASTSNKTLCVSGKFSLLETAALLEKLDLYITNDTGPMHMALAMQTQALCLFSPTDPLLCGPFENQNGHVIAYPKTCLFCLKKKCREPFCMRQISVEEVFLKAQALLQKSGF